MPGRPTASPILGPPPGTCGRGVREGHAPQPTAQVALVQLPHRIQMDPQGLAHRGGQHGYPVLLPLTVTDQHLLPEEIDILHAQAEGLEQPQPGPVQQATD
jgi:hypothetical protein